METERKWILELCEIHRTAACFFLVLEENGGHHLEYTKRAKLWLDSLASAEHFAIKYIHNTDLITEQFLDQFQLIIQLDFPPYTWTDAQKSAFEKYIDKGKGGWLGFHHATLLGEFDGYSMWQWFSDFMGSIRFKNYIADFAQAEVNIEKKKHPVMQGVPASFTIKKEEWYTYDKSPRKQVTVLASVDENSYEPDTEIKMGDHPVIWTNESKAARNLYIFMGHSPILFENQAYTTLFKNAIFWAAGK